MYVNGDTLVRTRFAPAPIGFLHIGGVRTAIFNYLYARRFGGSFMLRIDDTDTERNNELAVHPILSGLRWLGIEWDDGPIRQSDRRQHYLDVAIALVKMGLAYPDPHGHIDTGSPYRGMNRNINSETACNLYDDTGWAIRFRIPENQKIVLDDLVRKQIMWDGDLIGDPVIIRSNGYPTYNFATVVDDGEMKITHVIRGEEHINNTPVQILIANSLGHVPPFYAHVPYVCEPNSNKKLSKRDSAKFVTEAIVQQLNQLGFSQAEIIDRIDLNPVSLAYYETLGYKPAAIIDYLARLELDDKTEIMSLKQLQKHFDIKKIKSATRFDPDKMLLVNSEHIKNETLDVKTLECVRFLGEARIIDPFTIKPADLARARKIVSCCGNRIKKYSDILHYGAFFYKRPKYNQEDFDKYFHKEISLLVDLLVQLLKRLKEWTYEKIEDNVKTFMESRELKPRSMIFAIRVALCGHNTGPGLFESMEILGKEECLERLYQAMEHRLKINNVMN